MKDKITLFITACLCLTQVAFANSLNISSGEILAQDTVSKSASIEFNISWQNSWRDGENFDAAWVFAKYSLDDGATWQHSTLALSGVNPNGFDRGSGTMLDIVVPPDLRGAFIQRSSSGSGNVSTDDMRLLWDYGVDGVTDEDIYSSLIMKVFAVEMVYVPEGSFYAGDNNASAFSLKQGSNDDDPWYISDSGALNITNSTANTFYYQSSGYLGEDSTGASFSISSAYPTGFDDFYLMKYELTEGQWVSFFNTLTDTQKNNRDITSNTGKNTDLTYKRNTIAWTSGLATTSREDRVVNYLSWMDGLAFAEWAGLRPFTELEFEKAARGKNVAALDDQYAWGSTSITAATSISSTENGAEVIMTSNANVNYNNTTFVGGDGGQGPLRAGVFANTISNRIKAGAGYYGSTELSGNVAERVVSIGNATGRSFVGSHGTGNLSVNGYATRPDWPGYAAGEVTGALGSGIRGGGWSDSYLRLRVSDRNEATRGLDNRHSRYGFRLARTAP